MSNGDSLYIVHPDCVYTFESFKLRRKYKWVIFGIEENKDGEKIHVVISKETDKKKDVRDFINELPESKCRFAVFDHEYVTDDGRKTDKLFFINWNPHAAVVQLQMDYLTGRPALREVCDGCFDVSASSPSDIIEGILGEHAHDSDENDNDSWMD